MTNLPKRKPNNTNLDQKSSHKSSKKPYFYSAKMAPKKVDKLITLEVAKRITLERPKGGQTNNPPAYIYIYICCGVIIWSKFGGFGCYYLVQVCFFPKHRLPQNAIKIGVSALFFLKKKLRAKFLDVIIWSKLAFFKTQSNLDQIITSNLDQKITSKNAIFFVIFCFEKCAKMPIFIVFFEKQPKKLPKKLPKKKR